MIKFIQLVSFSVVFVSIGYGQSQIVKTQNC